MKKYLFKYIVLLLITTLFVPMVSSAVVYPMGRAYSGDKTVSTTVTEDSTKSAINLLSNSGFASTTVASASGFNAGNYILLVQMSGTGKGNYEVQKIQSISSNTLFFYESLVSTYQSSGAQVIKINEYNNVTVTASGSWQASAWNGTTGGVLVALINGTFTQSAASASTTVASQGFGGGAGASNPPGGTPGSGSGSGGGGGSGTGASGSGACGGGGGGHVASGGNGGTYALCTGPAGTGGGTYGGVTLASGNMQLGSGGGGGYGINLTGGSGGSGGGTILLFANKFSISGGVFAANGGAGQSTNGPGGGGSGGSLRLLPFTSLALGTSVVTSSGGAAGTGDASAGGGANGRIATNVSATVTGTASPTIDTSSTDIVRPKDSEALMMNLASSI